MNTCNQPSGCIEQHPTRAFQAKPLPSSYYLVVTAVPRCTLLHQALTVKARADYITSSRTRVKTFVKYRKFVKTCSNRHEQRRLRREHQNAGIIRISTGTRRKQGDLVLVKEADSALHNDCVHTKLTHERWTGPWTVTAVITPGLRYRTTLQERRERVRRAAASHIKPYYLRPPSLRHDFGDEYAHFAWALI